MKDDTRLRDGLRLRGGDGQGLHGGLQGSAAAGIGVYAALDLGTNNCRLLIAAPNNDGFRVVDGYSQIVRLGEGLAATGRLSDAAMERTIGALRVCADKCGSQPDLGWGDLWKLRHRNSRNHD